MLKGRLRGKAELVVRLISLQSGAPGPKGELAFLQGLRRRSP